MKIYERLGIVDADFVNIDLQDNQDSQFYIDPFSLILRGDTSAPFSVKSVARLHSFFSKIVSNLKTKEPLEEVVNHIGEIKYTKLGVSNGGYGRGSSHLLRKLLIKELNSSEAIESGLVHDIADMSIFIRGIGPDRISDLITNVIIDTLSDYTYEELKKYNECSFKSISCYCWDEEALLWKQRDIKVAVLDGVEILLVPKRYVLHIKTQYFTFNQYVNNGFIEALRSDYMKYIPEMREKYTSGNREGEDKLPTKKTIREKLQIINASKTGYCFILDMAKRYPDILNAARKEHRDYIVLRLNKFRR